MISAVAVLIFGAAIGSSSAQNCWTTGCQPNSWAVKGCAQYGRQERGREACQSGGAAGFRYNCCDGNGEGESGGGELVNFNEFSQAVTSNNYPPPSRGQHVNFNQYARANGQISTKQEAAMALAQLLHESDGLRARREYACESSQCPNNYRNRSCDAPGQYYYGRGYIQLTWCGNYQAASFAIFGDDRLVRDPDQVARDDRVAWQTAFWYWGNRVHNQDGVQQGRFGASTRAINPELECNRPGHSGPASRFRLYGRVRAAFGLPGAGDPSGCR